MNLIKNKVFSSQNVFSLIAILISIFSLVISIMIFSISEKNLDINLNPIIITKFIIDGRSGHFQLVIYNDGPLPIYKVKIARDYPTYELNEIRKTGNVISSNGIRAGRYWKQFESLDSGDSLQIEIPYSFVDNLHRGVNLNKELTEGRDLEPFTTLLFKISYRKEPEKTTYYIKKYLFPSSFITGGTTKLSVYDPEMTGTLDYFEILRIINRYEDKRPWMGGTTMF